MVYRVDTQSSPAVCQDGYEWMDNSKRQDPCLVASFILGPCDGGFVVALAPDSHYINLGNSPCTCNTPFYSMISACTACQGREYGSWPTWETNCTLTAGVDVTKYPFDVPSETDVPVWAYLGVPTTDGGKLNLTQAQQISIHLPPPPEINTSSTTPSPPGATAGSALVSSEQDPKPSDASASTGGRNGFDPTALIVGASLGGFVMVVLGLATLYDRIKGMWPVWKRYLRRHLFAGIQNHSESPESQRKADPAIPADVAFSAGQLEMNILSYAAMSDPEPQPPQPEVQAADDANTLENGIVLGSASEDSSSTSSRLDEFSWSPTETHS